MACGGQTLFNAQIRQHEAEVKWKVGYRFMATAGMHLCWTQTQTWSTEASAHNVQELLLRHQSKPSGLCWSPMGHGCSGSRRVQLVYLFYLLGVRAHHRRDITGLGMWKLCWKMCRVCTRTLAWIIHHSLNKSTKQNRWTECVCVCVKAEAGNTSSNPKQHLYSSRVYQK